MTPMSLKFKRLAERRQWIRKKQQRRRQRSRKSLEIKIVSRVNWSKEGF